MTNCETIAVELAGESKLKNKYKMSKVRAANRIYCAHARVDVWWCFTKNGS